MMVSHIKRETPWCQTDNPGHQSKNPWSKMTFSASDFVSFGNHIMGLGREVGALGHDAADPKSEIQRTCVHNRSVLDPIQYPETLCFRYFTSCPQKYT